MRRLLFALLLALTTFLTPTAKADWHGHGGWGGGWHGGWHGGDWGGNAAAGGFLGGLAGSIIGNIFAPPPVVVAPPPVVVVPAPTPELQPWTGPWYAFCAQKYRTFDAHTGSYTGFDGQPHFCGS